MVIVPRLLNVTVAWQPLSVLGFARFAIQNFKLRHCADRCQAFLNWTALFAFRPVMASSICPESMDISDARQGFGYGRALMGDLVDADKLMGIERIKVRAERVGRFVWARMGFLPTDDAWLQMRPEALDFIVKKRSALERKLDVMDLMSRILAGGPKKAHTLVAINVDVPSSRIPARFEPELRPLGKVFFLEIASPWSGTLDLRDDETMKAVESYR